MPEISKEATMKYYKTIVVVEVLSNEPLQNPSLYEIAREIRSGGWSGNYEIGASEEVSKEKMAELLIAQGSDPAFLIQD